MNYQERIHDFLDGVLDEAEEAELLRLAANNAHIREELRNAILLQGAFKSDVQALTPPPELTQRIFSEVRHSLLPTPQASIEAASGIHSHTAFTAVISSAVTALLLLFLNGGIVQRADANYIPSGFPESNAALQNTLKLMYLRVAQAPEAVSTPNYANLLSQNASRTEDLTTQYRVESYPNSLSNFALENVNGMESSEKAHDEAMLKESNIPMPLENAPPPVQSSINTQLLLDGAKELVASEQPEKRLEKQFEKQSEKDSWLSRVQIHARRVTSMSLPSIDFPSNPASFLRNTAVGALWKLNEQHSVGIELSEESYVQRFQARLSEGAPVLDILQNPALLWAGLAYRYTMFPDKAFSPILHGVLGGTELGANTRAMLGLTYAPDERTQFLIGFESSALLYFHQGTFYASPKIGFTYGVSLRL